MKGNTILLLAVLVAIVYQSVAQSPLSCYDRQVNLNFQQNFTLGTFLNGTYYATTGLLRICYNNTYLNVCGSNSSDVDIEEVAQLACSEIGYSGT